MQTTIDTKLGTIYLTTRDVAVRAGITPGSIRRLCCEGKGPRRAGTMGQSAIFDEATVTEWLTARSGLTLMLGDAPLFVRTDGTLAAA